MSDFYWPVEKGRKGLSVWRLNQIIGIIYSRVKDLSIAEPELPLVWNVKHTFSIMQLAKILALKRNVDPELAALAGIFHDIYILYTGKEEEHGPNAEPFIREIINEYNNSRLDTLPPVTNEELEQIVTAIAVHSDKVSKSDDPLTELLRDVDVLDGYLHGLTQGRSNGRKERLIKVFEELELDSNFIK
jgi:uncharacterized protein